jgi:hypothetical protein
MEHLSSLTFKAIAAAGPGGFGWGLFDGLWSRGVALGMLSPSEMKFAG